jgi:hypothetical protein
MHYFPVFDFIVFLQSFFINLTKKVLHHHVPSMRLSLIGPQGKTHTKLVLIKITIARKEEHFVNGIGY